MDFDNKVAVITGGAHGIGKAIADSFRSEGAAVEIIDIAPGDHYIGDISRKETLEAFASYVLDKHGHVDYLINNALPLMKGISKCSYEEFQYALSVGITAPFYLSKLFSEHFGKGGVIINISSSRDRMSQPQTESYTAAKGGRVTLSDLRSRENSMRSVEKFTGQHIPYTVPVVTEQRKVYSLSKANSRFSQRLIQEGDFFLIPA